MEDFCTEASLATSAAGGSPRSWGLGTRSHFHELFPVERGWLHTDQPGTEALPGTLSPGGCNSRHTGTSVRPHPPHTDISVRPRSPPLAYECSTLGSWRSDLDDVSPVAHCFLRRVSVAVGISGEEWAMDHHTCALIHFYFYITQTVSLQFSNSPQEKVVQIMNFDWRYVIEAAILLQFTVVGKNI